MTIQSAILALNPLAVFMALILHFVIGLIWYSPPLFGKVWLRFRVTDKKPEKKWVVAGLFAHVIYTFVLAVIIKLAHATTILEGLVIGLMVCVGFIGTLLTNDLMGGRLPFKLYLFKFGDELVSLCAAAILLAMWR